MEQKNWEPLPVMKFICKSAFKTCIELVELMFKLLFLDRTSLKVKLEPLPNLKIVRFSESVGGEQAPVGFVSYIMLMHCCSISCIFYLKNWPSWKFPSRSIDDKEVNSKVNGYLAFERLRNLDVILESSDYRQDLCVMASWPLYSAKTQNKQFWRDF